MADYWKSQPKKFCQYCKCWIADNKPSIEFHERGKNHKQNVAAKIEDIKKSSAEKAKKVEKMSKEFAVMEDAAMKAYEEDIRRLKAEAEATVRTQGKSHISEVGDIAEPYSKLTDWVQGTTDSGQIYYYDSTTGESQWEKPEGFQDKSLLSATNETKTVSAWVEATSQEGYTYYFNTKTGESTWEKPSVFPSKGESLFKMNVEGRVKLVSQPDVSSGKAAQSSKQSYAPKISFRKRKEVINILRDDIKKTKDNAESSVPPEKKNPAKKSEKKNPYGEWEQVQEDEDPYEDVDLQLPQKEYENSNSTSSVPLEPKIKFKERTVSFQEDESSLGTIFRKRKLENGKARSLRQRGKED